MWVLGSLGEADDAVQEAWLRLSRSDAGGVENLGAWLTTVVGRVSLDMLRSQPRRREEPPSVHVPEPILDRTDGTDPEHEALREAGHDDRDRHDVAGHEPGRHRPEPPPFHTQNTARNCTANPATPAGSICPARWWASREITTTNTRSKNSSSQPTDRCRSNSSSVRNAGRCQARRVGLTASPSR
jgi:hypothetical protein